MLQRNLHAHLFPLIAALALTSLSACGGGSEESAPEETASSAESVAPPPTGIVSADTDVRKKVLYLGASGGFVATSLVAKMPAGTKDDYDILVVGDVDKLGDSATPIVMDALSNGKEVVFDGPSDGSQRATHAVILDELVGATIDSAAVRVEKAPKGYYVTPIDAPIAVKAKTEAAKAMSVAPAANSIENVFGISGTETAK